MEAFGKVLTAIGCIALGLSGISRVEIEGKKGVNIGKNYFKTEFSLENSLKSRNFLSKLKLAIQYQI